MDMEKREGESEEQTTGDRSCPSMVSSCLRLDNFTTSDALGFSGEEKCEEEDRV